MRWLIFYFRSLFCEHTWDYAQAYVKESGGWNGSRSGIIVSATCDKCGWHRSYWKY